MHTRTERRGRFARSGGFALIEILIVIVIFGRVFFLGKKSVRMDLGDSKVAMAETQMRNLEMAVDMYRLANRGKLPATLDVLTKPDPGTDEPFISRVPNDPWNRAYRFIEHDRRRYEIRSAGPDGAFQTKDDVIWPKPEQTTPTTDVRRMRGQAETQAVMIGQAVEMYMLSNRGALPKDLKGLTKEDPFTGEPFLRRVPRDPWGGRYELRVIRKRIFEIRSPGPDKQMSTEDDVVWPKPEDE